MKYKKLTALFLTEGRFKIGRLSDMDTQNEMDFSDIKNIIINSTPYFDIKTLFNHHEPDPINRRLMYSAEPHATLRGSFMGTHTTDRELWPFYPALGWLAQDDINAGDTASSFRTLFHHVLSQSENKDSILQSIDGFNPNEKLENQYDLLVDKYAEFDWISDNLDRFRHYVSLVDTLRNIVVWDRIFNKVRGFDFSTADNFPLSLVQYQEEFYADNPTGWQQFITDNQLTMYVNDDYSVDVFSDNPLPKTSAEFGAYLDWITPKMMQRNDEVIALLA